MKDWLDKLEATSLVKEDEPPKGYVCVDDVVKRYPKRFKTNFGARRWLAKLQRAKLVKWVSVRRKNSIGRLKIVRYYGPA